MRLSLNFTTEFGFTPNVVGRGLGTKWHCETFFFSIQFFLLPVIIPGDVFDSFTLSSWRRPCIYFIDVTLQGTGSPTAPSKYGKSLAQYLFNLLKPTGHVMHQQCNIQQLYALPTLYLCVLYLSENKQRLVPLTA